MGAQTWRPPRRRGAGIGVLVISTLLLVGCQSAPDAAPPTTAVRPSSDSAASAVSFAPLRGTPAEAAALARPSLAVKIDNHEEARPQIALNRTDIVFEELVEGGLTRYVAIWHSDVPDEVGPVRSIRPMDPDIATPFGGIIAYSGGQEQFVEMMMATPLVNIVFDYDDTGLFARADERPGPHDVILQSAEAVARNAELAPPPMQFVYGTADPLAAPALAAAPTSRVDLVFSDARFPAWEWDAAASVWLRSQEGSPDLEASGERVRATNVVTLRVDVDDSSYEDIPKTIVVGSGEAWVSAGGRTAHGTWAKDAAGSPFVLTADDGSPLRLAPGNTWVELVPSDGSVAFTP